MGGIAGHGGRNAPFYFGSGFKEMYWEKNRAMRKGRTKRVNYSQFFRHFKIKTPYFSPGKSIPQNKRKKVANYSNPRG